MNCTRCFAVLNSNSNFCFNCGEPQHPGAKNLAGDESSKTNKFLVFLAIFIMAEGMFWLFVQLMSRFMSVDIWKFTRPFSIIITLFFAALPLIISFFLPQRSGVRTALMVVGIIFLSIKIIWLLYSEFFSRALNFQF